MNKKQKEYVFNVLENDHLVPITARSNFRYKNQ